MQDNRNERKPSILFNAKKASKLCFDAVFGEHAEKSRGWIIATYRPFRNYLELAQKAAELKQNVDASFFIVDTKKDFSINNWIEIDIVSKLINGTICNDSLKAQHAKEFGLKVEEISLESISVNGSDCVFIENNGKYLVNAKSGDQITINNNDEIIYNKREYISDLVNYHGEIIEVHNSTVTINNYIDDTCYDIKNPKIIYHLSSGQNGKDTRNQLTIELNDDFKNEISVYEVFFNESAVDVFFTNKKKTHKILKKFKESGRLVIDISRGMDDIDQHQRVHLATDFSQLRKQKNALFAITNRPSESQKTLLNLCKDTESRLARLDDFTFTERPIEYKILTDETREGTKVQRDFVQKALQTPDFMILQGPPGSGKTTAILELIYQLLKEGKKVLLCASTHVAIDNVLERIIKDQQANELLQFINPVRVGDEENVYSECVKDFVYSNMMSCIPNEYQDIVNESFNLVCGTTMGVQRFPLIDKAVENCISNSIEPIFDYMILDEASKTTFSEFLVPGVLCKKWIIVGDVKQLAPYVEKNDLIPSLLICEPLDSKDKRIALSLLNMYDKSKNRDKSIYNSCYIMSSSAIECFNNHLKEKADDIVAVTTNKNLLNSNSNIFTISEDDIKDNTAKLSALLSYNTIFLLEEGLVKKVLPLFNSGITFYDSDVDLSSDKMFNQYAIAHHRGAFLEGYKNKSENYGRKIEDEILWRLIRLYELNNTNSTAALNYMRFINDFKSILSENEQKAFDKTIETVSNIAIPSIIKILQEGVQKNSKFDDILHKGFSDSEKKNRFVMLDYQHRMHPDISKVSRNFVYNEEALKDSRKWKSKMNYMNNKSRFEIRDVKGLANRRNFNDDEVKEIINELEKFIEFAKLHPHSAGRPYSIAILAFYNGQVVKLRHELNSLFKSSSKFNFRNQYVHVSLNTVDKFQGQEADIVYLSMVQTNKVGFLDSLNRVNVAITRAREKIIVFGHKEFFLEQTQSKFLNYIFKGGE